MNEQENNKQTQGESPEAAPAEGESNEGRPPVAEGPPPEQAAVGGPPPLPPELQAANAPKEDRNMAMIAHLLGLVGFLGPLILYLVKKDESSEYVKFHMKQSMWWQIWANVAAFGLGIISIPLFYICVGILTFLLAIAVAMAAWIYAIIGAVQTSGGKDFEYLWVGSWVRRSMM
ncbi:MAG: DUF4870 domain-containing protein [Planctomycetes bacterium]|nr:DUF4870 domain-containing protein [Planctomycetota bacterium]